MAEKKPNPIADLMIFVAILVVLGVVWVATGGPERARSGKSVSLFSVPYAPVVGSDRATYQPINSTYRQRSDSPLTDNADIDPKTISSWNGKVRLRLGSWSGVDYPFQEYIYIDNITYGESAVTATISGWQIKNRGRFTGYPDYAVIPLGVETFIGGGTNRFEKIRLRPGERAIINTGRQVSSDPYVMPSALRVNKCFGYLSTAGSGSLSSTFYPSIYNNCDYPENEPGAKQTLNDECLNFIKREVRTCMTVKFNDVGGLIGLGREEVNDREGEKRVVRLSQACLTYLRNHYNYNSCVSVHRRDEDFFTKEWRVWLSRDRKLYAPDREIITLLDNQGKIVDQVSY